MIKIRFTYLLMSIMFGLLLNSCKTPRSAIEQSASADYGIPISQEQARALAIEFLDNYLNGPDYYYFKWGNIYTGSLREPTLDGGKTIYGYFLEVRAPSHDILDRSDRFGNYNPFSSFKFVFYNGAIHSVYETQAKKSHLSDMRKIF